MPKFSITSLLLIIAIIAVAICGHQMRQQAVAFEATRNRLKLTSDRQNVYHRALLLLAGLNDNDPESENANKRIRWLIDELHSPPAPDSPNPELIEHLWIFGTRADVHSISTEDKQYEVLSLHYDSMSIPGGIYTALALFEENELIDYIAHESSTRIENSHEIGLTDSNSDGVSDIEIKIEPGIWRMNQPATALVYDVSNGQLTEIEHDKRGITKR